MKHFISFIFILFFADSVAQRTVGLIQYDQPNTDGYVLFAPISDTHTYLIDKCGREIKEWSSTYRPALGCYLLEDGSLLRMGNKGNTTFTDGGAGGVIERYSWNGNLLWSYIISDSLQCQHHDAIELPNGNILAIVWDRRDSADVVQNGRRPITFINYLFSEKIVELQPVGTDSAIVIWEWKIWDHLIQNYDSTKLNYGGVSLHPELIDINNITGTPSNHDWIHMNSIDYNPALDQILLSSRNFNEIWIIDHSTTTAEAASHTGGNSGMGGDLMYRWGNVMTYDRGTVADRMFFGQHHATWIPQGYPDEGKIIVFNNGNNRLTGDYSSIDIIVPPLDSTNHYPIGLSSVFLPTNIFKTYTAPVLADFFAPNLSGVYPLKNGSFMVSVGPDGIFFELDSAFNTVWKYINPVSNFGPLTQGSSPNNNSVFRCVFYPPTYSAFTGITLTPGSEIELNPINPSLCMLLGNAEIHDKNLMLTPNPSEDIVEIKIDGRLTSVDVDLFDMTGVHLMHLINQTSINISGLKSGIYFLEIMNNDKVVVMKIVKN